MRWAQAGLLSLKHVVPDAQEVMTLQGQSHYSVKKAKLTNLRVSDQS